jgi:hypothetical protein
MRRAVAVAILLALVAGHVGPAAAEPVVVLPEADAARIAEEVRDARVLRDVVETLKAERAAQDEQLRELAVQIAALKDEARKREIAVAIAEDREKRRLEDEGRVAKAFERAEQAIERSERLLVKAEARIEALERRQFWTSVFGVLGLAVGLVTGGLLR